MERLLTNSSMDLEFLSGSNFGLNRRAADCSASEGNFEYGLADLGHSFDTNVEKEKVPDAAIKLLPDAVCPGSSTGMRLAVSPGK